MTEDRDQGAKLLALAVHEFRTPLSVVAGYLRLLSRQFGGGLTDQQRKIVEDSERSCGHLTALLAELSDLANLDAGRLPLRSERFDVAPILARLATDVHEGENRGVAFGVVGCGGPAHVVGDPVRLTAALTTLVTATLRERAERTSVVAACRIEDGQDGPVLRIAIAEPDVATTLLDRREPTANAFDEYRGGLGFRLVLASRIIAAHGGQVASPIVSPGRLTIVVTLGVS